MIGGYEVQVKARVCVSVEMRRSEVLFVRQTVCSREKTFDLQTDGKERERKTSQTDSRPPFYTQTVLPTCWNCQPSRGIALTPSSVLVSMTPLEVEEDRLIDDSLLC